MTGRRGKMECSDVKFKDEITPSEKKNQNDYYECVILNHRKTHTF